MDRRGESAAKETLLEMGSINNFHPEKEGETMVQMKRMHTEGNMLHDDRTPEDPEDGVAESNLNGSANGNDGGGYNVYDEDDSDSSSESESTHSHHIDPNSCKGKLEATLQTNYVQYTIIALVIADCLIIVLELLIDMEFIVFPENPPPQVHHNSAASHPVAYASSNTSTPSSHHHSDSHHKSDSDHDLDHWSGDLFNGSWYNNSDHGNSTHHPHYHTNKEKAEHILHALSLAILSLFMVEVCLKIYVEGKHLLKQKAEVFDAVVVIVSFTLDIVFSFVSVESAAKDAAGLMVLLRLWRVTRIINGVILSVKMDAKKKTDAQKKIIRQLEHESKKLNSRIQKLEKENATLKGKLALMSDSGSVGTNALTKIKSNSIIEEPTEEMEMMNPHPGDKT